MNMDLETLATLDAAGALSPEERREFERALAAAPGETRQAIAEIRELTVRLAETAPAEGPPSEVKIRLMARLDDAAPLPPPGFSFRFAADDDWVPHVVPGIRMKRLSSNVDRGYVTLLLDVEPGTRFPPHHHSENEDCYVISGSLFSCGRRFSAGDFLHASAGSDHGELWTDEGCRVLLVVPPEDYLPAR